MARRPPAPITGPPFLTAGPNALHMAWWTLGAMLVPTLLYSALYLPSFAYRFLGYVGLGLGLELAYALLRDGRPAFRTGSSAITAGLLALSVPPNTPVRVMVYALIAALVVTKLGGDDRHALRLNPVLIGRLFLMLAYPATTVDWPVLAANVDPDAVSTATPLDFFHAEGETLELGRLLLGRAYGDWEGLYEIVPSSPGEIFTPVLLLIGVVLVWRRVLDFRVGVAFLISFAASCVVLREPVLYNVLTGAVVFSAVFIGGDPRTTPTTRFGRYAAGVIAGIINALVRKYSLYSEGIVFAFLAVNLLAPTLDRVAFTARGWLLRRRRTRFAATTAGGQR